MNNVTLWETTPEGLIYLEPEGFIYSYYIYPPQYFNQPFNAKYQLWIVERAEEYTCNVYKFDALEEAREYAIAKIKVIIKPLLHIV